MEKIKTYSFCESFIDRLCDDIEKNYISKGKDLSRLALIFGGKRPALFIKRELARRIKSSFYPPRIFTIDEFVTYIIQKKSPFGVPLELDSCFHLYSLTRKLTPELLVGRESFSEFLPWTHEILSFIDHLDLEDIDAKKLKNIESNAQIGYEVPEDINKLLASITKLRTAYHAHLKDHQSFSRGFRYLKAAQMIKTAKFDEFDQFYFCNFFYFHHTEEMIVKQLYERNQATLIFQGDQRKWPVLERISRNFECSLLEGTEPKQPMRYLLDLFISPR